MGNALKSPSFTARRQRIVEAAVRLFADAPYEAVHMDAIAMEAAVAKPTLYRYFPDKESLFVAALEWTLDDLRTALRKIRQEPVPSDLKLRRLVALVLNRIEHLAPAIQAIESQNPAWGGESRRVLRQGFRNLRTEISELVRDGQSGGQFSDADPDLASLMILGGLRMAAHSAAHSHAGRGASLAASMTDLLLNGLRGTIVQSEPSPLSSIPSGAVA